MGRLVKQVSNVTHGWPCTGSANSSPCEQSPDWQRLATLCFSTAPPEMASPAVQQQCSEPAEAPAKHQALAAATSVEKGQQGVQELLSRGSALHRWGACKPCAFVFKEGCNDGLDCRFCHLCEPGERKRRKKERLAMKREALAESRAVRETGSCLPGYAPVL
jgi:hypothetical protein